MKITKIRYLIFMLLIGAFAAAPIAEATAATSKKAIHEVASVLAEKYKDNPEALADALEVTNSTDIASLSFPKISEGNVEYSAPEMLTEIKKRLAELDSKGFQAINLIPGCYSSEGRKLLDIVNNISEAGGQADKATKARIGDKTSMTDNINAKSQDAKSVAAALTNVTASSGGGSTIVTTQIATAYAPIFKGHCQGLRLGFQFSASAPIETKSLQDYGRQQLLLKDGGILNFTVSFGRSLNSALGINIPSDNPWIALRDLKIDRFYFLNSISDRDPNQLWGYISSGLTAKALRTSIDGDLKPRAEGTTYLGLGFDGPLFGDSAGTDPVGGVDIEARLGYHVVNKNSFTQFFGPNDRYKSTFGTAGIIAKAYIFGKLSAEFEYQVPFSGQDRKVLDSVAMFKIGYNADSKKQ